jgi:hypothetical protein
MRIALLIAVLALGFAVTGCATPATSGVTPAPSIPPVPAATNLPVSTPPNGELTIIFKKTGGIAGVNETHTLKPDGSVDSGKGPKQADGGAAAAAKLAGAISATGIYAVAPGKYMGKDLCCDRFTYELTLTIGSKSYSYTTVDGAEGVPPALAQTVGLVSQYVASAK